MVKLVSRWGPRIKPGLPGCTCLPASASDAGKLLSTPRPTLEAGIKRHNYNVKLTWLLAATIVPLYCQTQIGLTSADLYKLHSVGEVQLSPDGSRIAYAVTNNDQPGRPYSQTWLMKLDTLQSIRLERASAPRWSPDGQWIAYIAGPGVTHRKTGWNRQRTTRTISGTDHPLPSSGDRLTWSPDSKSIAFISATPGPEADANGDPMMITRYLVLAHSVRRVDAIRR